MFKKMFADKSVAFRVSKKMFADKSIAFGVSKKMFADKSIAFGVFKKMFADNSIAFGMFKKMFADNSDAFGMSLNRILLLQTFRSKFLFGGDCAGKCFLRGEPGCTYAERQRIL